MTIVNYMLWRAEGPGKMLVNRMLLTVSALHCVALRYVALRCVRNGLGWSLLCFRNQFFVVIYSSLMYCCFGLRMSKMSEYTKLSAESKKSGTMNLNLGLTFI